MLQILTCRMEVAQKYGMDAAVLLHNIVYWTLKNKAEGRHFHDGRYWTYSSRKALAEMYPCWSDSQIKRILAKLRDAGALLVADYNDNRMLRTNWYSPSDEVLALYGEEPGPVKPADPDPPPSDPGPKMPDDSDPMHCPICSNALSGSGQRIYNENKKLQQEEPPIVPQGTGANEQDKLFNGFWAAYPRKQAKQDARKAWDKLKPDLDLCRIMAEALRRQKRSEQWQREGGRYIPLPATWIRGRRWEDDPDGGPGGDQGGGIIEEEGVICIDD